MPVMHEAAPAPDRPRPWHGVAHYENFPVASWLVPAPLRPAVATLYRFARYADDVADEGDAPARERLDELAALDRALIDPQADHPLVRPRDQVTNMAWDIEVDGKAYDANKDPTRTREVLPPEHCSGCHR